MPPAMQIPRPSGATEDADTSTVTTVQAEGSGNGNPFSCNVCHRSYTRIDHLARHFRSHTREKPFTCQVCNKDFARADLLKRHAANHNVNDGNGTLQSNKRQKVSQPSRPRISQACVACSEAKLRCEGPAPCKRCQQKALLCSYPEARRKKRRSRSLSIPGEPADTSASGVDDLNTITAQQDASLQQVSASQLLFSDPSTHLPVLATTPIPKHVAMDLPNQLPTPVTFDPSMSFVPTGGSLDGSINYEDLSFADFLKDIMMPNTPGGEARPLRGDHIFDYSPRDVLDFTVESTFEMPEMFDPGQQMFGDFTFQPARYDENILGPSKSGYTTPGGQGGMSLSAQAFKESLWLWTPEKDDYGGAEQLNLSMPSQDLLSETQCTPMEARIGPIDRVARDRILATILDTCDPAVVPRVVQSFPSSDLLTSLMHNFLSHHSLSTDNWVHLATFDPSMESPEILITLIAAGAALSPLPALRKLGFAFMEAGREAVAKMFERDNRHTRKIKALQAFALQLDVGLWSGDRRKMEIAESFAQPLVTMMRRGGRFRQPRHLPTPPDPNDDERTTESKWHQWIEAESFRRLAFHLLIRDCQSSISLLTCPLISYAEMSLEMPSSRDIWLARSAAEWKGLYLKRFGDFSGRLPSLRACIDDISPIIIHQKTLDVNLVVMIVLAGLWALTWQYREMTTAGKHQPASGLRNNALITNSMYREISQLLLHLRMSASEWTGSMEPMAQVLYERQLMHLHVSLEDVQLLAGKDGEEEARRVFPLLAAWADSRDARLALWHAGQVIKGAREFRRSGLRSSSAIALYHAALVLWAYSVVSKSTVSSPHGKHMHTLIKEVGEKMELVRLDGDDSAQVQRFIVLGIGRPALGQGEEVTSGSGRIIPISDARAVMQAMILFLRHKNEFEDKGCPPLVENLSKLMRSLGNAAQGMRRH